MDHILTKNTLPIFFPPFAILFFSFLEKDICKLAKFFRTDSRREASSRIFDDRYKGVTIRLSNRNQVNPLLESAVWKCTWEKAMKMSFCCCCFFLQRSVQICNKVESGNLDRPRWTRCGGSTAVSNLPAFKLSRFVCNMMITLWRLV